MFADFDAGNAGRNRSELATNLDGGVGLQVDHVLMRRTADPDAPNGLTDFVIIETISWMKERGYRGLGLNFATFRAVVSGEAEGGPWLGVERKVLHRFSDTMQIESLWKFTVRQVLPFVHDFAPLEVKPGAIA